MRRRLRRLAQALARGGDTARGLPRARGTPARHPPARRGRRPRARRPGARRPRARRGAPGHVRRGGGARAGPGLALARGHRVGPVHAARELLLLADQALRVHGHGDPRRGRADRPGGGAPGRRRERPAPRARRRRGAGGGARAPGARSRASRIAGTRGPARGGRGAYVAWERGADRRDRGGARRRPRAGARRGRALRVTLRTCLVTSQYPPQLGGVGHSAARVARLLVGSGFEVHVVAFEKHPEPLPFDEAIATSREGDVVVHRVKVFHVPGAREAETLTRSNREMFQALDHLTRSHRYAVLHGFFLYPAAYIASIVGRLHGVRVIASIRGNDVGKYAFDPLRVGFVRSALENADAVTSVATSLVSLADRALAPIAKRSRTILNSIDPARLEPRERPELPLAGTVIGSTGLFRYKKGLVHLFKALASLNGGLDYTLLMAGDYFAPEDREAHARALERHGLSPRTVLTGRIPPERMGDYLRLFDIVVFPSLFSE